MTVWILLTFCSAVISILVVHVTKPEDPYPMNQSPPPGRERPVAPIALVQAGADPTAGDGATSATPPPRLPVAATKPHKRPQPATTSRTIRRGETDAAAYVLV